MTPLSRRQVMYDQASQSAATQALLPAEFKLPQGEFVLDKAFVPLLYEEQFVSDLFAGNQFDAFDWMDGWYEHVNLDACS